MSAVVCEVLTLWQVKKDCVFTFYFKLLTPCDLLTVYGVKISCPCFSSHMCKQSSWYYASNNLMLIVLSRGQHHKGCCQVSYFVSFCCWSTQHFVMLLWTPRRQVQSSVRGAEFTSLCFQAQHLSLVDPLWWVQFNYSLRSIFVTAILCKKMCCLKALVMRRYTLSDDRSIRIQ